MKSGHSSFKSVRGHYEPAYYLSDDVVNTRAYQSLRPASKAAATADSLESWEAWNAGVTEVLAHESPSRESSVAIGDGSQRTPSQRSGGRGVERSLLDSVNRAGSHPKVFAAALESTSSRIGKVPAAKSTRRSRLTMYRSAMQYQRSSSIGGHDARYTRTRDCATPSQTARSASFSCASSSADGTVYGSELLDPCSVEEQIDLLGEETDGRTSILFEYFAATTDIQRGLTTCLISLLPPAYGPKA